MSRSIFIQSLPKNSIVAEIGVHKGDFSLQILQIINPRELHLIDPWKHEVANSYKGALYGGKAKGGQSEMDERYDSVYKRFEDYIRTGIVKIHRGYSADVLNEFHDEYFDWIYIDGNHLYEFVKQDLELSYRKTKHGGYITGDDYSVGGWWKGGVKKAVDEFIKIKPFSRIKIQFGQFLLKKG